MKLQDVKNMTFADLKAKRDEVINELKAVSAAELAVCFVAALTDAKVRDEKLGEQGKTITLLQEGAEAAKEQTKAAKAETVLVRQQWNADIDEANKTIDRAAEKADENAETLLALRTDTNADADDFKRRIQILSERCKRLRAQAETYASAMTTIQKAATDAIATRVIDQADQG